MSDPIISAEIGVGANDEWGMVQLEIAAPDLAEALQVLVTDEQALQLAQRIVDAVRDLNS